MSTPIMYKKIVDFAFGISERQSPYRHHHKAKGKRYAKQQARKEIRRYYEKEMKAQCQEQY